MQEEIDTDQVRASFELYLKLCQKCGDKSESLEILTETLGDRLAMCPYSNRKDAGWSYPSGLMQYSLSVLRSLRKVNDAHELNLSAESMIFVSLFHCIGKVGDLENDLFVDEDSKWHREKLGQFYKYNEKVPKMTWEHRSLWILSQVNVSVTREEWLAIMLSPGAYADEIKFYTGGHEPTLSVALNNAIRMTLALKDA